MTVCSMTPNPPSPSGDALLNHTSTCILHPRAPLSAVQLGGIMPRTGQHGRGTAGKNETILKEHLVLGSQLQQPMVPCHTLAPCTSPNLWLPHTPLPVQSPYSMPSIKFTKVADKQIHPKVLIVQNCVFFNYFFYWSTVALQCYVHKTACFLF